MDTTVVNGKTPTERLTEAFQLIAENFLDKLDAVVKYKHRDTIALFGAVSLEKEMHFLRSETLRELVEARFKVIEDTRKNKTEKLSGEYMRTLIAKGENPTIAYLIAIEGLTKDQAVAKAEQLAKPMEKAEPVIGKKS